MRVQDFISAKAIVATRTEVASNKVPYLGTAFFPIQKKMGIDLKQIRTHKGLPVTLNPSAYDTVSAIRAREGFKVDQTEMAFFKESMLVKEQDKIDLLRVVDANDAFATEIYQNIYNDVDPLFDSAEVVAERMRMQLLSTDGGHPSITLQGDNVSYVYNYDPDNTYVTNNYEALSGNNTWDNTSTATPITDIKRWRKAVMKASGSAPAYLLINDDTMEKLIGNTQIKNYVIAQSGLSTVVVDEQVVSDVIKRNCKVSVIVYDKMFQNESGNPESFYPEGFATLIPEGYIGKTFYGVTPEELEMINGGDVDTELLDGRITVSTVHTVDPAQDKTIVSEVLLPSAERLLETFTAKVYTPS